MLGIVERAVPYDIVQVMIALRFAVATLAVIALYFGALDIWEHIRGRGTRAPFLYYVTKVVIAAAVLFYTPGGMLRLAVIRLNPQIAASLTIFAMVLTCAYFIMMQTVKHLYAGEDQRTAWRRTVPSILATVLLMAIGASVHDRF